MLKVDAVLHEVESTLRFKIETVVIAIIVLLFVFALNSMVVGAGAEPLEPDRIRVIDGDTIAVKGMQKHVRLVGFNAPETRDAACPSRQGLIYAALIIVAALAIDVGIIWFILSRVGLL